MPVHPASRLRNKVLQAWVALVPTEVSTRLNLEWLAAGCVFFVLCLQTTRRLLLTLVASNHVCEGSWLLPFAFSRDGMTLRFTHLSTQLRSSGAVPCLVTQLCPTLCDPTDCSPPGSSVHGDSPGKDTGVGCRALLQGIFPTQGSDPGLPHCKQTLYCRSHQGSPRILEWVAYPFSRKSS